MIATARARIAPLITALIVWAPQAALACAVCSSGKEEANRVAFILTTAILSVLPLLMVGGLVWWLRRRARDLDSARLDGRGVSEHAASRASSLL